MEVRLLRGSQPSVAFANALSATSSGGSAFASRFVFDAQTLLRYQLNCCYNFLYAGAMPAAQIECDTFPATGQVIDAAAVGLRKIGDVNKVPNAGAISCRTIQSKNLEVCPLASCGFDRQRNYVSFRGVPFPDASFRICTSSVEISQDDRSEFFARTKLAKNLLDHQFASAVRVDRRLRVIFTDRDCPRDSIGCAG
jgi:hypothetical protein